MHWVIIRILCISSRNGFQGTVVQRKGQSSGKQKCQMKSCSLTTYHGPHARSHIMQTMRSGRCKISTTFHATGSSQNFDKGEQYISLMKTGFNSGHLPNKFYWKFWFLAS